VAETKENVLTLTYDLMLYLIPQLEKFPRSQKFMLADRIQNKLMDVLEYLIKAYYVRGNQKKSLLLEVNVYLEQLRYYIRLSKDLRCIDIRKYELIAEKVNVIGKQVGAWLKSLK